MPEPASSWQPMDTAPPRGRPCDLRLERSGGDGDRLTTSIARGASWVSSTSVRNPAPH